MNFGGRGGMGNMNQMLKQAQAMQAKMMKAQEELKEARVEGNAGGGMVSATVNGQGELVGVKISKEVVDPEDVEMLEDLILAAVSDAANKAREMMEQRMGSLTGGMKLPF
ncbi:MULTISPECIES: YbaB/EbfC family nucleoid-associated protein [unclassified Pyramidobacter]|uniref:YbaB/EbfC family nucleoid-associated protein n=1 Tax=unclassified Pyramidobacter TaxID=2632171 RepID=UPI000EA0E87E|nr:MULTISPECIES: YbaB/EbfC family nucleoid-associated protein [unclassified Pyramidobacter]MDY3211409.1 YbaB/EbfC family nucleoid-associated protein [Pyramidobacter sp.]RKJ77417.1 YbaB/EbfC family nucleoid-associated protein [Pyramidobacter sp. CG50-2]